MGIYNPGFDFDIAMGTKRALPLAGMALAIILLAIVSIWAVTSFENGPLKISLEKNPVTPNDEVRVTVTVANKSDTDAENVPVSLQIKERAEFDIYALNKKFSGTITSLSSGTEREVTFILDPVGGVLPGSYTLVARTKINGFEYEKEHKLIVDN